MGTSRQSSSPWTFVDEDLEEVRQCQLSYQSHELPPCLKTQRDRDKRTKGTEGQDWGRGWEHGQGKGQGQGHGQRQGQGYRYWCRVTVTKKQVQKWLQKQGQRQDRGKGTGIKGQGQPNQPNVTLEVDHLDQHWLEERYDQIDQRWSSDIAHVLHTYMPYMDIRVHTLT